MELDTDYFSLFHSGTSGGVYWVFQLADVAFIGLVVDPPPLEMDTEVFHSINFSSKSLNAQ